MTRLFFLLFFLLSLSGYSQEEEDTEFKTIFGSNYSSGGYGAPELKLGPINGETSLLLGGRGGWIIGHKFVIGGAGYGLTTNNTFTYTEKLIDSEGNTVPDSARSLKIDMGYGGLLLEYIAFPRKAIHLSFPVIIGAGGTSLGSEKFVDDNGLNDNEWTTYDFVESSAFFLVEPGVYIELNMTKFFRLSAGATYRYISGGELQRLNNKDLSDYTFSLALKFGGF